MKKLALLVAALALAVSGSADMGDDPAPDGAADTIPAGALHVGARAADEIFEGYGDALVPFLADRSRAVFAVARFSGTDYDERELNLGLGARWLLDEHNVILGANAFYDSRWTAHANRFDQFGLGIECLSDWVDFRANYYRPCEDRLLVDYFEETSTETETAPSDDITWGEIFPRRHEIVQEYSQPVVTTVRTITSRYGIYDTALEGFDAEIGVRLPWVDEWAETRLYIGYQDFDNPFGDRFTGIKCRAEIRPKAIPDLTLEGEFFDCAELNGTDYYVGARITVPFRGFLPSERSLSDRLTEMVIRDLKVQLRRGAGDEPVDTSTTETTSTETVTDAVALLRNVMFMTTPGAVGAKNGTWEHPFTDPMKSVSANGKATIYILSDSTLTGPLTVNPDVNVISGVTVIHGYGGRSYGGEGNRPLVEGQVTLHGNNSVRDIRVASAPGGSGVLLHGAGSISVRNTEVVADIDALGGVFPRNARLVLRNSTFNGGVSGLWVLAADDASVTIDVSDCTISGEDGMVVGGWNNSRIDCLIERSTITGTGGAETLGLGVILEDTSRMALLTRDSEIQGFYGMAGLVDGGAALLHDADNCMFRGSLAVGSIGYYLTGFGSGISDVALRGSACRGNEEGVLVQLNENSACQFLADQYVALGDFAAMSLVLFDNSTMDADVRDSVIAGTQVGLEVYAEGTSDILLTVRGSDIHSSAGDAMWMDFWDGSDGYVRLFDDSFASSDDGMEFGTWVSASAVLEVGTCVAVTVGPGNGDWILHRDTAGSFLGVVNLPGLPASCAGTVVQTGFPVTGL